MMLITKTLTRWLSDLDRRYLILLPVLLFLLSLTILDKSSFVPIKSLIYLNSTSSKTSNSDSSFFGSWTANRMKELRKEKIAVCLTGGARRFELTGPSIVKNVLDVYPNADLFLHAPIDGNSFKFGLLKDVVNKVVEVKIFKPEHIPETKEQQRVLTDWGSPSGFQGLLQYFNLVEGCLTMINAHQTKNNFTYEWIVRTRVDGYWNGPLDSESFIRGRYVIPAGSHFGGLNDRLGIGDINTSTVGLSRLSLIPQLQSAGLKKVISEAAFKAQFTTQGVPYIPNRQPFCILSDRTFGYPPLENGVPVVSFSSPGPLSGAYCRVCNPACQGSCVAELMGKLDKRLGWIDVDSGNLQFCDARVPWETGWEELFDKSAGVQLAVYRKKIKEMKLEECIKDLEELRKRAVNWNVVNVTEICNLGLNSK